MYLRHSKFTRTGLTALCGAMLISGLPRVAQADVDPHFRNDKFAADAAALLPKAVAPVAKATPAPDRITLGDWSAVIPWTPHIPVSAANLPDGRVLTFASNERTSFPVGPEFTYAATWNPATGQFVEFNHTTHDMFCGALVMLPDGRVLVNGGRATTVRSSIFDWRVNTWTRIQDMNDPRWYNTSVALPSGRVWTASGSGGSGTSERWDQAIGWSRLTGIDWNLVLAEPGYINIWHPFLALAPNGRLIHFGPTDTMHWVIPDGSGSMSNAGATVPGSQYPKEGAFIMYNEGRILVAGGGATTTPISTGETGISSPQSYTVDVRGGTPIATPSGSMTFARQFANSVVLPNGEVMVMGGNTSGIKFSDAGSILTAEIWNPTTGQWRIAADAAVPRNYHSISLLLPDGRVLSGGGGLGGDDHQDAELFTPPTLFNPDGSLATRPVLSVAPQAVGVGTQFTVTGTPGMQRFSFIKMSAITHSVNTDLRYLSLPFTETSSGTYRLTAHASLNVMTPGYWLLFGLNAAGVHSVARIVRVDGISSAGITAPGNQASYVGQPASLQMIGSGPSGSVLNWSATGLPTGLSINAASGLISGTPTTVGTYSSRVTVTAGSTSASADFTWSIQIATFSRNFTSFAGASGLTFNGNAALSGSVLRLAPNLANQVGSAFLTSPVAIGPNTSMSTRWVFRTHGTADGADGSAFVIQGVGASALGTGGTGLGYDGMGQSVAVEIDNFQGTGDPDENHLGILSNGSTTAHLATFTPGWDLENGLSHTVWVEYDGPANQLRVYAAEGIVTQRPASPVMTASVDLPALVGSQAWFGFSGASGGAFNNHDIESWSLSLNASALPAPPLLTAPGDQNDILSVAINRQMQATDPNGDLLTWSASGLPPGVSIASASGLISGTPTLAGVYSTTVTVTDGNTPPVSTSFTWIIDSVLTVQPLAGTAVVAGTTVSLTAQASGGVNPEYNWSFGDGTPDTGFSSSPSMSHLFTAPGRYLVTVTVRDDTGREVTGSYRQAVYAPLTAARPTASSSIIYESRAGANARLWVVNPDNDSVTVFDAVTRARLAEVNVGRAPRTLARGADGRVWVANAESDTLTVLNGGNYSVAQTVNLPRGSRPFGMVFDPAGLTAYVALENSGQILKLNPATGATLASLNVGLHVRHLSVTADGAQLLAARFVTPRLPGEETANVETAVAGVNYGGEVLAIDAASLTVLDTIILAHSEQPDTSNSARGIPNYLGAAVISPDGQTAWVPSKQDNIRRGTLRNGGALTHDTAMRSIASRIVMASRSEELAGRIDFDNAGIASAAAFDPNGSFLFAALEGSREIAVADAWANREILRFGAGRAPQGVVLSPDGRTLFAHNFMDRTVSIHDLTALANGSEAPPPAPVVLNCITSERLSPAVLLGKQFFYDTRDPRVAFQQYVSCASCHNDGGHDGRVWDFTQFGEGLRNTITLRGHGGTAHGPLHWTGNFDEVQDFEGQIRNFALGTGLMSDANFHAGTRSQPLGDSKAGLSSDLDALAAYVSSLTANGNSPDRNADGSLTAAAQAGRTVFEQQNCVQCHAGARFTDSALNVFHDVGTLRPSSGQRLGGALAGLDTPTLLGLWVTGPYLHDGAAATLEAAVSSHNGVSLTATEMSNLVAFLRQLDDAGIALPPPWQHQDIGAVGSAGDATEAGGTFTVRGSGADIWNAADGFHFTYQPWTGNGEIIARVTSVGNTDPWAKAGVMFRENLTAGSRHAMMVLSSGNGAAFQRRATANGASTHTAGPVVTAPYWVRLIRSGNTFTGYISANGATWTSVGSVSLALPTTIYVGLVVTAHNNAAMSTSTFTDVQVTAPVTPPTVALTAPAGGATFTAPASISLAASVTANGNTITRVQFLNNTTVIGEATTAPYAFTWTGVPAGNYSLTARALYGTSSTVTSTAVSVSVVTLPAAPTGLTATASSSSQIDLSWTAGSANHTGFKIERSSDGITFAQIATTSASSATYANTGLAANTTYFYRVRANNPAGDSPYSGIASATTLSVAAIRINFQPSGSPVPSGYLADTGPTYASRGNGYSYGWNSSNTANTRDRNSSRSADQRYDTLNHMQRSGGATRWEIGIPNGTYQVFVVAGDANSFDSVFRINVEGLLTVSGTPTSATRWISGTRTVTVSDGRLTVSNGSGASNNKICFIDITPVSAATALASASGKAAGPVRLEWIGRDATGKVTLRLAGAAAGNYAIEASSDLQTWEPVTVSLNADGTVSVDDANPENQPQRFYRGRLSQ